MPGLGALADVATADITDAENARDIMHTDARMTTPGQTRQSHGPRHVSAPSYITPRIGTVVVSVKKSTSASMLCKTVGTRLDELSPDRKNRAEMVLPGLRDASTTLIIHYLEQLAQTKTKLGEEILPVLSIFLDVRITVRRPTDGKPRYNVPREHPQHADPQVDATNVAAGACITVRPMPRRGAHADVTAADTTDACEQAVNFSCFYTWASIYGPRGACYQRYQPYDRRVLKSGPFRSFLGTRVNKGDIRGARVLWPGASLPAGVAPDIPDDPNAFLGWLTEWLEQASAQTATHRFLWILENEPGCHMFALFSEETDRFYRINTLWMTHLPGLYYRLYKATKTSKATWPSENSPRENKVDLTPDIALPWLPVQKPRFDHCDCSVQGDRDFIRDMFAAMEDAGNDRKRARVTEGGE